MKDTERERLDRIEKLVRAVAAKLGVEESEGERLHRLGKSMAKARNPEEGYVPAEWRDR